MIFSDTNDTAFDRLSPMEQAADPNNAPSVASSVVAKPSTTKSTTKPSDRPNVTKGNTNSSRPRPAEETKKRKKLADKDKNVKQGTSSNSDAILLQRLDRLENMFQTFMGSFQEPDLAVPDDHYFPANSSRPTGSSSDVATTDNPGPEALVDVEGNPPARQGQEDLDPNIAIGFAARFAAPVDEGAPLSTELANSLNYLIYTKLEDKQLSETADLYARPSNCLSLVVPKVNKLIWDHLSPSTRSLDLKIQRCERPLIKGMTALTSAFGEKELSNIEQDALALLSNAVFELNQLRKELIKPELNQKFSHLCKHSVQPTEWLFGDNLPKTVKDMEEEQKSVSVMKVSKDKPARFRPYFAPSDRQRFQQAGWTSNQRFKPLRPFLGQGQRYRQSPQDRFANKDRPSGGKATKQVPQKYRRM